jgi:hypothetical protein
LVQAGTMQDVTFLEVLLFEVLYISLRDYLLRVHHIWVFLNYVLLLLLLIIVIGG